MEVQAEVNSPVIEQSEQNQNNTRESNNFGGPRRGGRGGSRFSGGRGGQKNQENYQSSGDMSEPKLEIEPPQAIQAENADQSVNEGPTNFGGPRRGRGGSRFNNGPGPMHRGGFRFQRGGGPDRNEHHMNPQEFRGRGRGRGGFRGGRGGGEGGRGGPFEGHEGGPQDGEGGGFRRGPFDKVADRIASFQGPTFDLPPLDIGEKQFNGRNRLYIGNISADFTDEDLTELFKPYGETAEIFLNKEKNFGFIKLDYHANAEKAKRELDGINLKGKTLKIRFAPNTATVKVKNLPPYCTNELLTFAFSPFGEIEKAHVDVDERGKPTGEGYIHFARKFSAAAAIKKCSEGCYFLSTSLQPVVVEAYDMVEDADGYSDRNINRKHPEFLQERETPPRFARPNSFEFEYGQRWKALYELHQQKEEALKKELQLEKEKLIAQMEYAKYEHETELLRNQLRVRELDKERQKREWEMKERMAEEERARQEETMRKQQEDMEARMMASQEDMKRRQQENSLFLQAHNLDSLLEQQEQVFDQPGYGNGNNYHGGGGDMEPKQFMSSYERHNRFDGRDGHGRGNAGRGHWVSDNRRGGNQDDYQNKRRRF